MTTYYVLPKTPNQTFEVQIEGVVVSFQLHMFRGLLYIGASIDGEAIVECQPVVGNTPILPRDISMKLGGNFMFETLGNGYPSYEMFETIACRFCFVGFEE